MTSKEPPRIIEAAGPLLELYDLAICDVWGVVHDGVVAHAEACEALARFRAAGGRVVLLSNAPMPGDAVAALLDEKQVPRNAWDAIVSSGDLTLAAVANAGWQRLHWVGPARRDASLFDRLPGASTGLADAQAVVVSGLVNDRTESPEQYAGLLQSMIARRLPLVCANPDRVVVVGGAMLPCAGSIAEIYEAMGGPVIWAGKPYPIAYEAARAKAAQLDRSEAARGNRRDRVIVIGDALVTDLAGAAAAGHDALFVGHGIHREQVMIGNALSPDGLAGLFVAGSPPAVAAIAALRW